MKKLKKRVCIVTLYGNYNVGNKLQNYAVQEVCKKQGYISETLKTYEVAKNTKKSKIVNELKRFKYWIYRDRLYINKEFKKFQKKHFRMHFRYVFDNENNEKLEKKYDKFIVGSDQVWNPFFGLKGDLQFLQFVNSNDTIAFSASIGVDEIPEDQKERYIKGIKNIDYLSVREDKGKEIIQKLTNREDVQVLVDPTMLLTKKEWKKISKKPKFINEDKYILTYFLGNMSEDMENQINIFAKENNYKIINVIEGGKVCEGIGPAEFVYLEEHAELICTDSFHSCVFGILMETPFIIFNRQDSNKPMNSRIETLLSKFKLQSQQYKGCIDKEILEVDYKEAHKILEEERKKSFEFLNKALHIKEN